MKNVAGCVYDGGEPTTKSAAAALAQGHPKAAPVPVKWGMKNQQEPGEGTKAEEARDRRGG